MEKVVEKSLVVELPHGLKAPKEMVWIPGGQFQQGAVTHDKMAMQHEKPSHIVGVDGFFIDEHEVTNSQFYKFVEETGYKTIAEREIDWEELKKQVPYGTPKPHDSILKPGSLIFKKSKSELPNLYDFSQWWEWKIGANWRHPKGPGSSILGLQNHPVVHIAYEDALAYCEWAGSRLPTEAEWEYAARGGLDSTIYQWGDEVNNLAGKANTWNGIFPMTNTIADGYESTAPVKTFEANDYGLYDMAGNVWEWTSDWYNTKYYGELMASNTVVLNPEGANESFVPNNPYAQEKVIKGGSFLCNASYCASYRLSSRMGSSIDSSLEHLGFRTVVDVSMLQQKSK
ncbi:formylglycine-generating enzyme required for sulfatase activity [Saonia flava]|uniref:Formylglycine-generating enzyme required for sulfatase activity n=1 Tax=Saonia flava TaxID=523696 RepID=A0A846QY52_9FLAO|nr:formylglycine-generating enzyme family protein [Saonia flava]NJB72127.1 formylglycine-generating enzyme required for sulfatase activity [Saonia flava]